MILKYMQQSQEVFYLLWIAQWNMYFCRFFFCLWFIQPKWKHRKLLSFHKMYSFVLILSIKRKKNTKSIDQGFRNCILHTHKQTSVEVLLVFSNLPYFHKNILFWICKIMKISYSFPIIFSLEFKGRNYLRKYGIHFLSYKIIVPGHVFLPFFLQLFHLMRC